MDFLFLFGLFHLGWTNLTPITSNIIILCFCVCAMQSTTTSPRKTVQEEVVSIIGQKAPSPPPASHQNFPFQMVQGSNNITKDRGVTPQELDKRLNVQLKTQATQW